MRYVARDAGGNVVAIFDRPPPAAPEVLDENDPELIAFVTGGRSEEAMRSYLQDSDSDLLRIIEDLRAQGAEGVIEGCTEIGLLVQQDHTDVPLYDTTKIHARQAVIEALN